MSNNIKIKREQYAWATAYAPAKRIDRKLIFLNVIMMLFVGMYFLFSINNSGSLLQPTAVLGVSTTAEDETMRVKHTENSIQSEALYSYGKIPLD